MDAKLIEELRQKYSKNPPEGMTSNLVKNMTDSDLLDMHQQCLLSYSSWLLYWHLSI